MKNLIYTTAVNMDGRDVDDNSILSLTRKSWDYWCEKNNIDFYVIDEKIVEDTSPHWFRYHIMNLKPDYDRYLYIDSDIMVKWDSPNIFDVFKDETKLYAVRDNAGLAWIWEGINAYKDFFPDVNLEWDNYFNSGVLLFSKHHKDLFDNFIKFYLDNRDKINHFQKNIKKGYDQTPFNYFTTKHNVDKEFITDRWNLSHMIRKEILAPGYFINMGNFWHFNGFPREQQYGILKQIWESVEEMYSE
tara:strand:- start:272 stop:1006 length:735 start_codon:yes stop_codon:yes gene_type:complete